MCVVEPKMFPMCIHWRYASSKKCIVNCFVFIKQYVVVIGFVDLPSTVFNGIKVANIFPKHKKRNVVSVVSNKIPYFDILPRITVRLQNSLNFIVIIVGIFTVFYENCFLEIFISGFWTLFIPNYNYFPFQT